MKKPLISLICLAVAALSAAEERPNILFIAIDDLRPELGCYGSEIAISPNLDALAADGLLFNRAYCQEAICSPSRASIMTGARPDTIGVVENYTYFRDANPDIVTLPQHLIAQGYEAVHSGKIYHGKFNDPEKSWSRTPAKKRVPKKTVGGFALPENRAIAKEKRERLGKDAHSALLKGPAYESADVPDNAYEDGYATDLAIGTLHDMLEKGQKPFFLGLGFKKPHLDFVAPKRYWDLYDRDSIPLAKNPKAPEDGAAMGLHASFELRTRHGIPKYGDIDDELARTLLHGYLACVSYVDAQIGRMINELEEVGERDNTIIIVWGDHGWHLGDMGIWGKATNYEISARVPLMIWTPDMPAGSRGKTTDALVELVDMYPTLCDLVGVDIPEHVEGHSFKPLLEDPDRSWKTAAFSQYPNPALREWAANPLTEDMRELFFGPLIEDVEAKIIEQQKDRWDRELFEKHLMSYTMRTDTHRLVLWKDYRNLDAEPIFVELYDHDQDPDETKNIAADSPELVEALIAQFDKGWKGSLPN
ncbi:sulfatase [Pelagicoccus mobilis]|uniref:Sulfatase n=1 Tax=Pelagicoccus mobilis TaxID=415221 RepID=A0A934RR15_9BACT|nr:sulfatase [Pelagicoccus mobilis]MBK1875965.1 sulfatase [Pelagicoccus mobilis]